MVERFEFNGNYNVDGLGFIVESIFSHLVFVIVNVKVRITLYILLLYISLYYVLYYRSSCL